MQHIKFILFSVVFKLQINHSVDLIIDGRYVKVDFDINKIDTNFT